MFADPVAFGVTDMRLPCLFPNTAAAELIGQPVLWKATTRRTWRFSTGCIRTYVIHAQIEGIVAAQVGKVPLPAYALLLFAGIAGLAALRRRA